MTSRFRLLPLLIALVASTLYGWAYPTVYEQTRLSPLSSLYGVEYPTVYGDTGLVLAPTIDVIPVQEFQVAFNYTPINVDGVNEAAVPVQFSYGIVPNGEVSAFFSGSSGSGKFSAYGGGTKIRLVSETEECHYIPGLAVGIRALVQTNSPVKSVETAYLVSSYPLLRFGNVGYDRNAYGIRAHVGGDANVFSGRTVPDATIFMPFAGLSYENSYGVSVVSDYLPRLEKNGIVYRDSTVSGAIRFPYDSHVSVEFGTTRPFAVIGKMTYYAGISYHSFNTFRYLVNAPDTGY